MKAYDYILEKQIQWALNNSIQLVGSKGQRGRPAYTPELNQNLFEPLEPEVLERFNHGDGYEINGNPDSPAKMQAVHSSSALVVNIFQYWQKLNQVPIIAAACGLCKKNNNVSKRIVFEDKYQIDKKFRFSPNIDVVIHNDDSFKIKRFAIECKFSEPYSTQGHLGLKREYLTLEDNWKDIPGLLKFAKEICQNDDRFKYLHSAQLIKHILGLKAAVGKEKFRLLYLWYDALGEEGTIHKKEIDDFSEIVRTSGIKFHSLSVHELIVKLSNDYRSNHEEYIKYITNRYL